MPLTASPGLILRNAGGARYSAVSGACTLPVAGLYLVTTTVRWQALPSAGRICLGIVAGSVTQASSCQVGSTTDGFLSVPLTTVAAMQAGGSVHVAAAHTANLAASVGASTEGGSHFSVTLLR